MLDSEDVLGPRGGLPLREFRCTDSNRTSLTISCPIGFEACPIPVGGLHATSTGYECIKTQSNIESCKFPSPCQITMLTSRRRMCPPVAQRARRSRLHRSSQRRRRIVPTGRLYRRELSTRVQLRRIGMRRVRWTDVRLFLVGQVESRSNTARPLRLHGTSFHFFLSTSSLAESDS